MGMHLRRRVVSVSSVWQGWCCKWCGRWVLQMAANVEGGDTIQFCDVLFTDAVFQVNTVAAKEKAQYARELAREKKDETASYLGEKKGPIMAQRPASVMHIPPMWHCCREAKLEKSCREANVDGYAAVIGVGRFVAANGAAAVSAFMGMSLQGTGWMHLHATYDVHNQCLAECLYDAQLLHHTKGLAIILHLRCTSICRFCELSATCRVGPDCDPHNELGCTHFVAGGAEGGVRIHACEGEGGVPGDRREIELGIIHIS